MPKITLLGAGSGFTLPLFTDILNVEGLDEGVIGLVDVDVRRLGITAKLMPRLLDLLGKKKWKVEASTDRTKVLKGTDYLISTIEVSGTKCIHVDFDIPLKYGVDQCIADTIGPGGVMKALRTLPAFLEILDDAGRLCPQALIMNYTNPMSIITLAASRASAQPLVGLCHSVQGTSKILAQYAGVPYEEMQWKCGGINHMAWFTELRWRGRDLYPVLREVAERTPTDLVRFDMMKHFGYFVTESSGHMSEYIPYYRKNMETLEKFSRNSTASRARHWLVARDIVDQERREMAAGKRKINLTRSHEYASHIVEAHVFDRRTLIHASVPNTGLIPNLPQTGVVEVGVLVDRRGYTPTYFGNLPEQVAALCRSNMAVFELCAAGILERNREAIIHSMMLDPLSAAVCSPGQIRSMAEELFAAQTKLIPRWCSTRPKVVCVKAIGRRHALTDFVTSVLVSDILPAGNLETLPYPPDRDALGFTARTFSSEAFCNLHAELGKAGAAMVFFLCRFKCAQKMRLAMLLGYDGPVKVWIDGQQVFFDASGTNPADQDKVSIPFDAAPGQHEALIGLDSNTGNAWGIHLRFERLDVSQKQLARPVPACAMPEIVT